MMKTTLIQDACIVNEGQMFQGSVLIEGERIVHIYKGDDTPSLSVMESLDELIDARGKYLIPGLIDTHVHFRDPGLTHKADMQSESKAALAGGVTSFLDMPNTKPQTTTIEAWQDKMNAAASQSWANYAFYLGATNENLDELLAADYTQVPAVKLFMGSSTGNMLVDDAESLRRLFTEVPALIAVHCESEAQIQANKAKYLSEVGEDLPIPYHSLIRDEEVCYQSTSLAVQLARQYATRLHVMHISTAKELALFDHDKPLEEKKITAETCPHYLLLCDDDYARYGSLIKCNPALKHASDKQALLQALNEGYIDTLGSDHAPHLLAEKQGNALTAVSGCPSVQFNLLLLLEMSLESLMDKTLIVDKFCHAPATIYRMRDRGYLREGYYADMVLFEECPAWVLDKAAILSKCAWSPYEGWQFHHRISQVFVNGAKSYDNGEFAAPSAKNLIFKI